MPGVRDGWPYEVLRQESRSWGVELLSASYLAAPRTLGQAGKNDVCELRIAACMVTWDGVCAFLLGNDVEDDATCRLEAGH